MASVSSLDTGWVLAQETTLRLLYDARSDLQEQHRLSSIDLRVKSDQVSESCAPSRCEVLLAIAVSIWLGGTLWLGRLACC